MSDAAMRRCTLGLHLGMLEYVLSGERTYEDINREFHFANNNTATKFIGILEREGWIRKKQIPNRDGRKSNKLVFVPLRGLVAPPRVGLALVAGMA